MSARTIGRVGIGRRRRRDKARPFLAHHLNIDTVGDRRASPRVGGLVKEGPAAVWQIDEGGMLKVRVFNDAGRRSALGGNREQAVGIFGVNDGFAVRTPCGPAEAALKL